MTVPHVDHRPLLQRAFLAGTAKALRLLERVPETFRKRGWKQDEGAADLAALSLCYVHLANQAASGEKKGAELYVRLSSTWMSVPKEIWGRPEWRFAGETEGRASAAEVVAHLDLKGLLTAE